MSLHKGLVWLADGFEKYDAVAKHKKPHTGDGGSGDYIGQSNTKAAHRLSLNPQSVYQPNGKPKKVKSTATVGHQYGAQPARHTRSKSISYQVTDRSGYLYPSSCKRRSLQPRPPALSVPNDRAPRTGSKPARSRAGSRRTSQSISTSYDYGTNSQYVNMPTHPDMRFFDRHSRCFNYSHCNAALVSSRPRTACSAGRSSLEQCQCCGEITSKIRYQYAPTGSAMTGMDSGNKTYLYPEKILPNSTCKRRPSSAPSRTSCSQFRPSSHYVVRGDVPHFCNFVRPCSVYDKQTGAKMFDNRSSCVNSFLDEFSSLYDQPCDKLDKGHRIRERLPDSLESCMPNSGMRSGLDRYNSSGDLGRHSGILAAEPGHERERFSDPSGVKLSHQTRYSVDSRSRLDSFLAFDKKGVRARYKELTDLSKAQTKAAEQKKHLDYTSMELDKSSWRLNVREIPDRDQDIIYPHRPRRRLSDHGHSNQRGVYGVRSTDLNEVPEQKRFNYGNRADTQAHMEQLRKKQRISVEKTQQDIKKSFQKLKNEVIASLTMDLDDALEKYKKEMEPHGQIQEQIRSRQDLSGQDSMSNQVLPGLEYRSRQALSGEELQSRQALSGQDFRSKQDSRSKQATSGEESSSSQATSGEIFSSSQATSGEESRSSQPSSGQDWTKHTSPDEDEVKQDISSLQGYLAEQYRSTDGPRLSTQNIGKPGPVKDPGYDFSLSKPKTINQYKSVVLPPIDRKQNIAKAELPNGLPVTPNPDSIVTNKPKQQEIRQEDIVYNNTKRVDSPYLALNSLDKTPNESMPVGLCEEISDKSVESMEYVLEARARKDRVISPKHDPYTAMIDNAVGTEKSRNLSPGKDTVSSHHDSSGSDSLEGDVDELDTKQNRRRKNTILQTRDPLQKMRPIDPIPRHHPGYAEVNTGYADVQTGFVEIKTGFAMNPKHNHKERVSPRSRFKKAIVTVLQNRQLNNEYANFKVKKHYQLKPQSMLRTNPQVSQQKTKSLKQDRLERPVAIETPISQFKQAVKTIIRGAKLVSLIQPKLSTPQANRRYSRPGESRGQPGSTTTQKKVPALTENLLNKTGITKEGDASQEMPNRKFTNAVGKVIGLIKPRINPPRMSPPLLLGHLQHADKPWSMKQKPASPKQTRLQPKRMEMSTALVEYDMMVQKTEADAESLMRMKNKSPPPRSPQTPPVLEMVEVEELSGLQDEFKNADERSDRQGERHGYQSESDRSTREDGRSKSTLFDFPSSSLLPETLKVSASAVLSGERKIKDEEAKPVAESTSSMEYLFTDQNRRIPDLVRSPSPSPIDWPSHDRENADGSIEVSYWDNRGGYRRKTEWKNTMVAAYKMWDSPLEAEERPPPRISLPDDVGSPSTIATPDAVTSSPSVLPLSPSTIAANAVAADLQHMEDLITDIQSETIPKINFGDSGVRGFMHDHPGVPKDKRKRPQLTKSNVLAEEGNKQASRRHRGGAWIYGDSDMSVDSRESRSATDQEETKDDPTALKSDRAEVKPGTHSLSVSTEPETDQKQKNLLTAQTTYPKYATKVGAGGTAKDPFAYDPTARLTQELKLRRDYEEAALQRRSADGSNIQRSPLKMQAWMNGRLALSKQASRFELPMDVRQLETMTPLQYLSRYCVVTSRRQMLYDKIYMKHKDGSTGKLGFQDLQKALSDVLIHSIDNQRMKLVIDMLLISNTDIFDKKLFYGVAAFAERFLYPIFARGEQFTSETQKERIESADFYALKWKLHGVNVNTPIRTILEVL